MGDKPTDKDYVELVLHNNNRVSLFVTDGEGTLVLRGVQGD